MPGNLLLLSVCAAISALITFLSIRYALRNALLDLPGQRRSHSVPTPRGGGIGIVVVAMAAWATLLFDGHGVPFGGWLLPALAVVAVAGWIDDHRGLGVRVRLACHFLAAIALCLPIMRLLAFLFDVAMAASGHSSTKAMPLDPHAILAFAASICIVATVWSINLHNFMDGIDGLLAWQALFVFLALAWSTPGDGKLFLLACAAAVAGFLPFNFPRAKVFMGDIGSGTLGLLIAAGAIMQILSFRGSMYAGLIACSAFVVDTTCTLLSRMLGGRRWYSAHREHLYQWLARSGFSHARVVAFYMAWNLCVNAPVLYMLDRAGSHSAGREGALALAVYVLALATWIAGKRWCLRQAWRIK
ncbi:MAG: glycosyltransferase family 4 protein [Proteobacteria bacterium]|nr:glycosyltransferase family 4 protein [Pseudomonadota bacterium]